MALKLVGRHESEFVAKDGSGMIKGINLHCVDTEEDPVHGSRVERLYIHSAKPGYESSKGIPFGSILTPIYNRFGKVEDITWREAPAPAKK
ncbi:MAG: hypothetical protein [Inoviridae sp.]|nr:MAG: hypothetical protein [Inoviridae sp.]